MEFNARTKKWRKSLVVILPKDVIGKEQIHENDLLTVHITKAHTAGEFFGKYPLFSKRSTQEIKDEMRKGWD